MSYGCLLHACSRVPSVCSDTLTFLVQAQAEGFAIVRQLGLSIPRTGLNYMSSTPQPMNTFIFWLASRLLPADFKELLASSAAEARMNIDEMDRAAPGKAAALFQIRPQA